MSGQAPPARQAVPEGEQEMLPAISRGLQGWRRRRGEQEMLPAISGGRQGDGGAV